MQQRCDTMNTVVSVVIAAFNASDTLSVAIESALNQQGCAVELLIVDDCSSDDTLAIASKYAQRDCRVRVFQTPRNAGPSTARNLAFYAARGEWLTVLDADDWFSPNRLATLLSTAEQRGLDMIMDSYYLVAPDQQTEYASRFTGLCPNGSEMDVSLADFVGLGLGSSKPMIKTAFLRQHNLKFDTRIRCGEDLLLYSQVLLAGATCQFLNHPMYFRTELADSLSRKDRVQSLSEIVSVFELLETNVSVDDSERHADVLNAISCRKQVTQDALAAAKWKRWLANPAKTKMPSLRNVLELTRHMCFRKSRYAICTL